MVELGEKIGIKPAARELGCTDDTVRYWVKRFKERGLEGLLGERPGPKNPPNKISKETEDKIIALRKRRKNKIGPLGIKEVLGLSHSTSTIYRVLKENGLTGRRKRKHHKKKNLREIKDRLKPFEKIQVDVKYLDDIPQYFEHYLRYKLPRYQFTARDEKTGAVFISFAYENTSINASSFITYLMEHLKRHGVITSEVTIQTDNGSEFTCPHSSAKTSSLFSLMVEKVYGGFHVRIPKGRPDVNADVEAFHRMIEDNFYDLESYSDKIDFLNKAYTFQLVFNYLRPNRYRRGKTPVKILNESNCGIDPAVLSLPPIILDYHSMLYLRKLNPSIEVEKYQKSNSLRVYKITEYPL